MTSERINIVRRSDGTTVDAELLSNLDPNDLLLVERQWEASRHEVHQKLQLSRGEGFKGRVGLHALPQAEQFYREKCGMTPLGKDASKQ